MRFPDPFKHARHSAYLDGFSLHAGVRIHENDHEGLERLRVVPGVGGGALEPQAGHAQQAATMFPPMFPSPRGKPTLAPSGTFALAPPPEPPALDRLGPRYRVPWAELLRKVFSLDVLACPQCAGRMELIAFIAEAGVAKRILDHLGLASTGPPAPKPRAPEEALDPGPDYGGADPTYDD